MVFPTLPCRPFLIASAFVASFAFTGELCVAQDAAKSHKESQVAIRLDERNLAQWRDHILPDESELAFERIGWLPTFAEGIARAGAEDKPLLLWVMNGHPLGCT